MPLSAVTHPLGCSPFHSSPSPKRSFSSSRLCPSSPIPRLCLPFPPSPKKLLSQHTAPVAQCSTSTALLSSSSLSSADEENVSCTVAASHSASIIDVTSSSSTHASRSADVGSTLSVIDATSSMAPVGEETVSSAAHVENMTSSTCATTAQDPFTLTIHLPPNAHTTCRTAPAYQTVDDITIIPPQASSLVPSPLPQSPLTSTSSCTEQCSTAPPHTHSIPSLASVEDAILISSSLPLSLSSSVRSAGVASTSTAGVDQVSFTHPSATDTSSSSSSGADVSSARPFSDLTTGVTTQNPSSLLSTQLQSQQRTEDSNDAGGAANVWALFMLFMAYVHQSASGTAVPSMLPLISPDLSLNDFQGALLTTGYFYLYAIALVPVGLAADKTSRPLLLSAGLTLWSALCMKMGQVHDFSELLMARVGFAAAQATQNPISFALIPELFPNNKTTALAVYNCAQYVGRALSFAAVLLARSSPVAPAVADQVSVQMLPLDQLDFHKTSLLYTQGNMAAVLPIYDYNYQVIEYGPVQEAAWRHLLWYIGVPGLILAGLLAVTVREPRSKKKSAVTVRDGAESDSESEFEAAACTEVVANNTNTARAVTQSAWSWMSAMWSGLGGQSVGQSGLSVALAGQGAASAPAELGMTSSSPLAPTTPTSRRLPSFQLPSLGMGSLGDVWNIPGFREVTLAAAMNDVGCYALIAWHSTFYERVYHLDPSTYAPLLAAVMPIGGIIGGVGGGWLADYLDKRGGRAWMTVGASLMAAPFMAESLFAPTYQMSFLALLCGFAMSEAWRSPAAIMIRTITPSNQASTATAVYICIRNLVGGMAPLAVAKLSEQVGLQKALLVAPACYVFSGLIFLLAEDLLAKQKKKDD